MIFIQPINALVGSYSIAQGNMTTESFFQFGEDYADYSYATECQMVISKATGIYTIVGSITCENYNTYNFSFTGVIDFDGDDEQGIGEVQNDKVQSTKILRNGQLIILRGERQYNVLGTQL